MPDASFGVLAGTVRQGATLSGVTVSGTLEIGKSCIPAEDYSVGLLFGIGSVEGMDHTNIQCILEDPDNNTTRFTVNEATGEVTLTFAE